MARCDSHIAGEGDKLLQCVRAARHDEMHWYGEPDQPTAQEPVGVKERHGLPHRPAPAAEEEPRTCWVCGATTPCPRCAELLWALHRLREWLTMPGHTKEEMDLMREIVIAALAKEPT